MPIFSILKKLLGLDNKGLVSEDKNPSGEDDLGTMIRTELRYQMNPLSPELTASQMAEKQAWTREHIRNQKKLYKGEVILGTYVIEDIKAGGMGYVYIANHKDWNIKVAIKSPNEKMLSSKSLFSRVLKEANSWIELGLHPHIAYCYYVRQIDEIPHIFIEYVDGGNLKDWIINKRCQDLKIGIDLAIQFCHGMEYAHNHGMIHRDVKPQNILMTSDGILKITDFGIARTYNSDNDLQGFDSNNKEDLFDNEEPTSAGAIMGSIEYMSPEQWLNPHDVDPRADIYSYGLCLYEMLCGKMPYNSSVRDRKPEEEPYNPHKIRRGIPNQLGDLLLKCVSWRREDRYNSFGELRKELLGIYRNCFNEEAPHAKVIDAGLRAQGLNNRAVSYIELNRKEEAINLWEEALIEEPQHLEATYNRDIILWREGKITDDELIKHLKAVKNGNTDDVMAEYLSALVHLERGDKNSALKILEEPLIQDKNKPELKIAYDMAQSNNLIDIKYKDTFLGHESEIHSVFLSDDDRYAVTGSGIYGRDNLIRLWDIETGECLKAFEGHTGAVSTVCFSKDGSLIVSGSYDNSVQIWSVKTGKNISKLEGHNNYVNSVCISSDNRYVLSGSNDVTIRLWDLNKKECLKVFDGHAGYVNSLCISHDNRYALSGSNDRTLRLWDLNTDQCIRIFHGHKSFVRSVHLSKDSKFAISGSDDNTIKLWDVDTGECLRTLPGHKGFVRSVFISNDNLYAISGGDDKSIRIWDLVKGKCLRTLDEHEGFVRCVCLSSDNSFALSGGDDRRLISWDLSLGRPVTFPLRLSRSWSHAELVNIDKQAEDLYNQANKALENNRLNNAISTARQLRNLPGHKREPKSVELWSKLSSMCIRTELKAAWHVRTFRGHRDRVTSLSMDSDNRFILSGSNDETIRLWDIKTGDCLRTFEGHTMGVRSVSITADGRYALSGGGDETLRFWDVKTGECVKVFGENKGSISTVYLSLNGKMALTAGISVKGEKREDDNYLRLWNITKGECIRTFAGHTNWVNSCYLSSDERYAISGGYDNTVKLWEVNTERCLRTFKGHTGTVYSVGLSSNMRYAISGSGDGTIRLWSMDNGECLRILKGHKDFVSSIALSKDNRYAISGGRDNTIRIWDAKNGQCLRILEGHTDWVNSISVSNDYRYIVSGSEDETIRLWELDWELETP